MTFRTIFIESQCRCSYQGGYLVVRKTDDTKKIHLSEISSIILQNTQVYLSAYLLAELAKCKISLVVADEKCNPIGQYLPLYGAHNASKRVAEQLALGEPIKKRVWQQVVKEKIRQQARVLEEKGQMEAAKALYVCRGEVKSGDTTNREAHAARLYLTDLIASGAVVQADTLEELAEKIGCPVDTFVETCTNFNKYVAESNDPECGRVVFPDNAALEMEGPFYACKRAPAVHHTMGGIKVNVKNQALAEDGSVIPGLYAAGEVTGGFHGSNRLGGNAISEVITTGRNAATNLLAE